MIRSGFDPEGLWTLSRGLARAKPANFQHLQAADLGGANDFDGRVNLSDAALSGFYRFFLERTLDQIDFMTGMISHGGFLHGAWVGDCFVLRLDGKN